MDGGYGSVNGIIDTQGAVGGWPVLQSAAAPLDTDNDGMPDDWEISNGLSYDNPGDAQLITVDGNYPNIEVYINSLVADIISNQNLEAIDSTIIGTEKLKVNDLNLYFNNNTNELNVSHDSRIKSISIYSITGNLVKQGIFYSSEVVWQTSHVPSGIYIVRLIDENSDAFSRKINIL